MTTNPNCLRCGPGKSYVEPASNNTLWTCTTCGLSWRNTPQRPTVNLETKYRRYPSLRLYDTLEVPYILTNGINKGPLWTGAVMMLDANDEYDDIGFFHELAHWWIAPPEDRQHPDFRLGRQVNNEAAIFTSNGQPLWLRSEDPGRTPNHNAGWGQPTKTQSEAGKEEDFASLAMALYEAIIHDQWVFPGVDHVDALSVECFNGRVLSYSSWLDQLHQFAVDVGSNPGAGDIATYIDTYRELLLS